MSFENMINTPWTRYENDDFDRLKKALTNLNIKRILSVMSGQAAFEDHLKTYFTILCTDGADGKYYTKDQLPGHVEYLQADQAIQKYTDVDAVFMSWPPYDTPDAYNALTAIIASKVQYFIYCGEYEDGCTADDSFFELLKRAFDQLEFMIHGKKYGIYDSIAIYKKK